MMVAKKKTVFFLQLVDMVQKLLLGDILRAGRCYIDQGIHLNRSVLEMICVITPHE